MRACRSKGGAGPESISLTQALIRETLASDLPVIRAWLRRRCNGDADAADEVLAAFCLRALSRAGEVREARAVRQWLSAVLRTTLADHWRARRRSDLRSSYDVEAGDLPAPSGAPDGAPPGRQEFCGCVDHVLRSLPANQHQVLRCLDLAGESRNAVARRLGVSRDTLRVRLHRARAAFRTAMLDHCKGCFVDGRFDPWSCPGSIPRAA